MPIIAVVKGTELYFYKVNVRKTCYASFDDECDYRMEDRRQWCSRTKKLHHAKALGHRWATGIYLLLPPSSETALKLK